jgi:uncharacterized membrane protein
MPVRHSSADRILEGVALILLLSIFAIVAWNWPDLPERVPKHFNASGQPDSWGGKSFLWFLPGVSAGLYLLMTAAAHYPGLINLPIRVDRSLPEVRQILLSMTIVLKVVILMSFVYITQATIDAALGQGEGLGGFFLPVFLAVTLVPTAFYVIKLRRFRI